MDKHFTGVGSRQTPVAYKTIIQEICTLLHAGSYILRSGGADGADTFFEDSYKNLNGNMEIYIPWKGFNNNSSDRYNITNAAIELASNIHPAWNKCSRGAKLLHARNCYQLLGYDLSTPSSLVVCYTENGECKGGTATVISMANKLSIPIFNLGNYNNATIDDFILFLEKYSLL